MNAAKLKQNAFWVGCGAALLILVALYLLMYQPKADLLKKRMNDFRNRNNFLSDLVNTDTIPGRPDIDALKAHKAELIGKLEAMVKFYQEKDLSFEAWFSELNTKEFESPNSGQFRSTWETEKNRMNDALKGPDGTDSNGFKWEEVSNDALQNRTHGPALMKDLQKMYWIRVRIWEAIRAVVERENKDKKRTLELQEVAFLETVYSKFATLIPGMTAPTDYPQAGMMVGKYPGLPANRDFVLPGSLGRAMTFGVTLKIKLSDLPNVLATLLDPNARPNKMMIELIGVRLEPAETNEFKRTVDVEQDKQEADMAKHRQTLVPVPVNVRITVRVLDFDKAKLEEKATLVTEAKGKN